MQYFEIAWKIFLRILPLIYIGVVWYATIKARSRNAKLPNDDTEKIHTSFWAVVIAPLTLPVAWVARLIILFFKSLLFIFFLPIFILLLLFNRNGTGGFEDHSSDGWLHRLGDYILENSWWASPSSNREK